ncbi:BamA/TamA family outer membrane protein [Labilibaculum euxinus]
MKKLFLSLFITSYFISFGFSQEKSFVLKVVTSINNSGVQKNARDNYEKFFVEEMAFKRLENKISKLKQKGYLEASVDSVSVNRDTIIAVIHQGGKYEWAEINFCGIDNLDLSALGLRSVNKRRKFISFSDLEILQTEILNHLGDNGYPFATLKLSRISIANKKVSGEWEIEPHDFIRWDSVVIKGTSKLKPKFLQRYLGIYPNKTYKESSSKLISEKIGNLGFVKEIKASEIEFERGKARLYTYLEKEPANQFDGIIGFQTNKDNNKPELIGEVKLALENIFSAGESIRFNWQKYEESSQNLSLGMVYPYLFSSGLGIDFGFDIQKKDSAYLSTAIDLGFRFTQSGKNFSKLFFKMNSSSLLTTNHLASVSVLPDYADVKSYLYGFAYHFENLDYSFNPKKGWKLNFSIATGTHKTRKNAGIPNELYDNIDLSDNLIDTEWVLEYNIPVQEKISFRLRNRSGLKDSKNLFQNDLFKLGGLNSLRGFNEDSFIASKYSVMTTELRFIPQQNSSFYLFWDGGYYSNNYLKDKINDYPWGIGFGLNFASKSGIFTLNYAVGKQRNAKVDFKEAKIHFGFVSRF